MMPGQGSSTEGVNTLCTAPLDTLGSYPTLPCSLLQADAVNFAFK